MNVTRNVKPRDLADWPVMPFLALFFWGGAALLTFSPVLLLAVLSFLWMYQMEPVVPMAKAVALQVVFTAAVLTPLYFAPGICRLARSARLALLGSLASAVALAVFLYSGRLHS
ncbi:hypothetical protein [Streptomyces sp. H-KF8]|uniref:hypothetical protein n=1 Tax=Streptomyces sp. H-KF8 TaxID=1727216 RepID=UPI001331BE0A|nr:hypothetical protein [Streptomyces sp. H-KF8]